MCHSARDVVSIESERHRITLARKVQSDRNANFSAIVTLSYSDRIKKIERRSVVVGHVETVEKIVGSLSQKLLSPV